MVGEPMEHNGFVLDDGDYDYIINQLNPLIYSSRGTTASKKFVESLVRAIRTAKNGGIFHIFVEITDGSGRLGYKIHNDPIFAKIEEEDANNT